MSIPPQIIRVKRKRVEETPVTFLQFDEGAKRARSGSNWVYQRRGGALHSGPTNAPRQDAKPIIHVSKPDNESTQPTKRTGAQADPSPGKTLSPRPSLQRLGTERPEPRRFHLSRAMMAAHGAQGTQAHTGGVSKKNKSGPAVFVERSRKKMAHRALQNLEKQPSNEMLTGGQASSEPTGEPEPERKLKKPTTSRAKSPRADAPSRAPLPQSSTKPHTEDMDKIAADMNQWVLNEIGANLHNMEVDKKREEKTRFRPKAPAKRYHERHPEQAPGVEPDEKKDTAMTDDLSEDDADDSDWVIDEYVRIPAKSMNVSVLPGDVGVLVLDGEGDDVLFFGPEHDEDDDYLEDDEDENAENHYTADYPEEEVDTDDEYGRHPYYYRNANASDDEEFDNDLYSSDGSDEMVVEGDDDDVTMARIKAYMRRRDADFR